MSLASLIIATVIRLIFRNKCWSLVNFYASYFLYFFRLTLTQSWVVGRNLECCFSCSVLLPINLLLQDSALVKMRYHMLLLDNIRLSWLQLSLQLSSGCVLITSKLDAVLLFILICLIKCKLMPTWEWCLHSACLRCLFQRGRSADSAPSHGFLVI